MKSLSKKQLQLSELLKAGLWGEEADASLFGAHTDWGALMGLAAMQSCMGIAYDGMLTLPARLQPPRGVFLQWTNVVARIEENNESLDKVVCEVFALYRENGLTPLLLKGQGVARNYRHPHHRQSGDIDVYVGGDDFKMSNRLLRREASGESEGNHRHTVLHWHGIVIENHRIPANLSAPSARGYFHSELHKADSCSLRTVRIGGEDIPTLPLELDIAYLLVHTVIHLLNEGVGLRQVCDWCCMLHAHKDELDTSLLVTHLEGLGMLKAARVFASVAVCFLGLPADRLPFVPDDDDDRLGDEVLQDILEGGSFGRYHSWRQHPPKGCLAGKWHTFTRIHRRYRQFGQMAPGESRWRPLHLVAESVSRMIKHLATVLQNR